MPAYYYFGVKEMKFNDTIKYIRITSIDQIDFENLDPEYLHQLAKAYANLSRSLPASTCEDDIED